MIFPPLGRNAPALWIVGEGVGAVLSIRAETVEALRAIWPQLPEPDPLACGIVHYYGGLDSKDLEDICQKGEFLHPPTLHPEKTSCLCFLGGRTAYEVRGTGTPPPGYDIESYKSMPVDPGYTGVRGLLTLPFQNRNVSIHPAMVPGKTPVLLLV